MDQLSFIRKVGNNLAYYAWFLGAGSSQSAGLPTAVDIIWELKTRYYCTAENQRVSIHDVQNPAVREKINSFGVSRGLPQAGSSTEYADYFKLSFGDDLAGQQAYLRSALDDAKISLSIGSRALAAMMASGLARVVFTTNFDNVLEKAMAYVAGRDLHAFHLEGSHAAVAALNRDEFPLYCKLHGDFRYEKLKNLPVALQQQDAELSKCVGAASTRFGLIVAGYSGRDESVMKLLSDALSNTNAFPHGIYWLVMKNTKPLPTVTALIEAARAKGITAEVVEIETFDSVLTRLWRQLPAPDEELDGKVRKAAKQDVSIPISAAGTKKPILRTNALPIVGLPEKCLTARFTRTQEWEALRDAANAAGDSVAFTKEDEVYAWGLRETVKKTFAKDLKDIGEADIRHRLANLDDNLFFKSFFERVVCLALKRGKPLLHRTSHGHSYLIADGHAGEQSVFKALSAEVGKVSGIVAGLFTTPTEEHPERQQVAWAEAVEVSVEVRGGRPFVMLQPTVWIWPKHGRPDAVSFLDQRRGKRFNAQADKILSAWIGLLLPSSKPNADVVIKPFDGDGSEVENPSITINNRTGFSQRLA